MELTPESLTAWFQKLDAFRLTDKEDCIFSIGGRGHYENPTTEVIAYFCDSDAQHGLGSLMVKALFNALNDGSYSADITSYNLCLTPEREVSTKDNKRIDLFLESDDWCMVIENKIYNAQNNPFVEYEDYAIKRCPDKKCIYVVLCPTGKVETSIQSDQLWLGISYPDLVKQINLLLGDAFIKNPTNKWLMLLREFTLHLEQLMPSSQATKEAINFTVEHLNAFKKADDFKKRAINQFTADLMAQVDAEFPGESVETVLHHWNGYPAIRFSLKSWEKNTNIALYLSSSSGELAPHMYVYLDGIQEKEDNDRAMELIRINFNPKSELITWKERGNVLCFESEFKNFDVKDSAKILITQLGNLYAVFNAMKN